MIDEFFNGNYAIAEAQKCRRMLMEQTGARSIWCIVARKGFWPPSYYFPGDENLLREKLNQGHRVLLVFAVSRRRALASCSGYQVTDPSSASGILRRFARQAMKHPI